MLVLYDTQNAANTRILFEGSQTPTNATFKYGDDNKLLLIAPNGLQEYDLSTSTAVTLDPNFNGLIEVIQIGGSSALRPVMDSAYYVLDSAFSPNGRWLIYGHWDVERATVSYYVVDLAEALYATGSPGGATPTALPTYTPVGATTTLTLTPLCSPAPATYRTWRISNPNPASSDFGGTPGGTPFDTIWFGDTCAIRFNSGRPTYPILPSNNLIRGYRWRADAFGLPQDANLTGQQPSNYPTITVTVTPAVTNVP
jgi:hypothetical protein